MVKEVGGVKFKMLNYKENEVWNSFEGSYAIHLCWELIQPIFCFLNILRFDDF